MITKRFFVYMVTIACLGATLAGCSGSGSTEIQTPSAASSNLSPQEKIFRAAAAGDIAAIKSALASDSSLINVRGFNGMTPLHSAAMDGQTAAAKFLLEQGADPSLLDDGSSTPANTAMAEGHKDTAKVINDALAKKGADAPQ